MFWNHSKQHSSKTVFLEYRLVHQFWNHSKQHSSKTCLQWGQYCTLCFGTIRNNTALKLNHGYCGFPNSFGTIRNNTALKLTSKIISNRQSFGTIRNNTALKPRRISFLPDFVIALLISAWLQLQNNSIFIFIIP